MGNIIAADFAGDNIFIYEHSMNTLRGHLKCYGAADRSAGREPVKSRSGSQDETDRT